MGGHQYINKAEHNAIWIISLLTFYQQDVAHDVALTMNNVDFDRGARLFSVCQSYSEQLRSRKARAF